MSDVKTRDPVREAFAARLHEVVDHLVESADSSTILEAMAMADSLGGMAVTLQRVSETDSASIRDPFAAARARGAAARAQLIEEAGGLLRLSEAAERLGVTPQAVTGRRQRGTILAVPLGNGEWVYPACQFTETGLLEGLDAFLAELPETASWTRLQLLLRPAERFGGKAALELLHEGRVREAAAIARSYERQG